MNVLREMPIDFIFIVKGSPPTVVQPSDSTAKLMVIGSTAVDVTSQARVMPVTDASLGRHSTSPGTVGLHLGGVGRNVAEAAYRISTSKFQAKASATVLVSLVGDDSFGRLLLEEMRRIGMRTDGVTTTHQRSAVCNMVLDGSGNLIGGVADMDIVQSIEPEGVRWYLHTHGDRKPIPKRRSSPRSPNMIRPWSQWTLTFHRMYSRP
jgi:pseudouridylate synthase / pseudouridine kinase